MSPKISIIIPARHEEETIVGTIDALRKVKTPHEILVINDYRDNSDKTADMVPCIKYTPKNPESGFAEVLAYGVKRATAPYIVFVMADGCDDPATIDQMFTKIKAGYDVVCGSRYMNGGKKIGGPLLQGFFSRVVNYVLSKKLPTTDSTNSFKLYKKELLLKILGPVRGGVEYSVELIHRAQATGGKVTEIPTTWYGRTKGSSKFHMLTRIPKYLKVCFNVIASPRQPAGRSNLLKRLPRFARNDNNI